MSQNRRRKMDAPDSNQTGEQESHDVIASPEEPGPLSPAQRRRLENLQRVYSVASPQRRERLFALMTRDRS